MPNAPAKWCAKCRQIHQGDCPRKAARKHQRTTSQRGYGWDWQEFTKRIKRERVLCEDCKDQGRVTVGTEVHHLVKIVLAPERRLDETNVRLLCDPCHNVRTARGE